MAEQTTQPKEQLLSPLMRWFLLAMILANIAGTMSRLLMPIYLIELGASVGQGGLVFTLASVAILALQVLGGWISDNIGRLRAIAISSVGGVIGFILMLLAPTWQWMLVALTISQIPYALVEPRYYFVPYSLFTLMQKRRDGRLEWLATSYNLVLALLILYLTRSGVLFILLVGRIHRICEVNQNAPNLWVGAFSCAIVRLNGLDRGF